MCVCSFDMILCECLTCFHGFCPRFHFFSFRFHKLNGTHSHSRGTVPPFASQGDVARFDGGVAKSPGAVCAPILPRRCTHINRHCVKHGGGDGWGQALRRKSLLWKQCGTEAWPSEWAKRFLSCTLYTYCDAFRHVDV